MMMLQRAALLLATLAIHSANALSPGAEVTVGAVRVQALSDTLIRVEPKGPMGFEDNTTFMVVSRDWQGVPLTKKGATTAGVTTLETSKLTIKIDQSGYTPPAPPPPPPHFPQPMCTAHVGYDLSSAARVPSCPESAGSCLPAGATQQQCCDGCTKDTACKAWIYDPKAKSCWLMTGGSLRAAQDRVSGGTHLLPPGSGSGPKPTHIKVTVTSKSLGTTVFETDDLDSVSQNLNWPSPHNATVYAIKDYPRFYTPPWGPTPIPEGVTVDPALEDTNGYDFRNDQTGDTYLFVIDSTLDAWHASRAEFVKLAGPTPVLPDFAFGTWFTWWDTYTETQAKSEVTRWQDDKLPIDVWALDMNWRNSKTAHGKNFIPCANTGLPGPDDNCTSQDHYYDYPDCDAFPGFCGGDSGTDGTEWFDWLKEQGLRTCAKNALFEQLF